MSKANATPIQPTSGRLDETNWFLKVPLGLNSYSEKLLHKEEEGPRPDEETVRETTWFYISNALEGLHVKARGILLYRVTNMAEVARSSPRCVDFFLR